MLPNVLFEPTFDERFNIDRVDNCTAAYAVYFYTLHFGRIEIHHIHVALLCTKCTIITRIRYHIRAISIYFLVYI